MDKNKTAIIFGAGPAGLTAAHELLESTNIKPIIFEMSGRIGGISRTISYKGNKMDIGCHRFFSKSDMIMEWWQNILPVQGSGSKDDKILNRTFLFSKNENAPDPEKTDIVMLIRKRFSRIYFFKKFFDYPLSLNINIFTNLGLKQISKIILSYLKTRLFPKTKEKSLEDYLINRFGKELYRIFFKNYAEKVWGIPCSELKSEIGIQKIEGLSITKAAVAAIKDIFFKKNHLGQTKIENSLIKQFLYPKLGAGQLWEEVAKKIEAKGGKIFLNHKVVNLKTSFDKINEIKIKNELNGKITSISADFFLSSMPVKDLINSFEGNSLTAIKKIADGLVYRDFIAVGLLVEKLKIKNNTKIKTINNIIPDTWIYIQEKEVKLGRIQILNNWSPYMVKDMNNVWLGLEYFCGESDAIWKMDNGKFIDFAVNELVKIGFIDKKDVLDGIRIKVPKAYPAYFGTYDNFHIVRNYIDQFENLSLIGRNGMHRYNDLDHSMLSAITAVENIKNGITTKDNIWNINNGK